MQIFKVIFWSILTSCCFVSGILFYLITHVSIDFSSLENYDPGSYSVVLDDQGNELTRFQLDRREPVSLDMLSPVLIQAFLAAEDQNFFVHHGISLKGIARSFLANFYRRKIVQGASTITQQLIKLLFLDNSRTFKRKIKELFLALIVESQFSKEQILQTYLNHIYLGCGIYGAQAAAQRFWRTSADKLSIAQAATLAGIVQSPERFCPLIDPEKTIRRRNVILKRMLKQNRITNQEFNLAIQEPLALQDALDSCCAPHIKEMLRQTLEAKLGKKELYSGGFTIQTTLSTSLQKKSNAIFKRHMQAHQKSSHVPLDGGFVLIEGTHAKIKALIGGIDFNASQFNRVTQAQRQLGSIFKPLIYALALQEGARMDDICVDEPITIEFNNTLWSPGNYNHIFKGPVTRAFGFYRSLNTIAVQTLYVAGIQNTVKTAHACGITQGVQPYPSLALGCIDASPLQAVALFNCFAHQGVFTQPYYIEWIKDRQGTKIYKHTESSTKVLSWQATSQVASTLCAGMIQLRKRSPAGSSLHAFGTTPLIGKTGTTNDARSCFFVGATPGYTAAAYIGNDENRAMGNGIFASQTVLPLVIDILKQTPCRTDDHFMYHPDLQPIIIHEITGQPLNDLHDPHAIEILVPLEKKEKQ